MCGLGFFPVIHERLENCLSHDLGPLFPELRMQEMVSMGIGNKPFMDIKPSDAAISDRAIDYIMKGAGIVSQLISLLGQPEVFCLLLAKKDNEMTFI